MTVGPEDFFKRIEESGLLNDSIVEQKDRLRAATSGEEAAADLVSQKLLTAYQSEVLLSGEDVPLVLGDYVVTESIGRGGMGYVLKARHRRMKRTVAIKFLLKSLTDSDDLRRRFEREVEAAAQLDHQNIVTAYDAGIHEGSHYLVMQYVDGEDLSQIVKSSGPLDISDAVDVIRQAALGLGYAHDRGIIHRDIKPGNLLLDSEGVVRILDMGLARMMPSPGDELEGGAHADLTNTGSVMGTIDYMAPEQALDAKSVDHRADIYALGCTLYFLLTSNPPFRNETVMRRLLAHREQPAPRISEYRPDAPRELDDIFATMMAKSPNDRYSSMKHLVVALDSLGLNDLEAEQMATLDVPDDGNGGFVKLSDASDLSIPELATSPATSPQSGKESSAGATRRLPDSDVTILETPSNVSALNTLADAEPAPLAGTSDTDFTGISETIVGDSQSIAGAAAARAAKSPPPWKLIVPIGLAVVALIAFLMTRPDPVAEDEEPARRASVDVAPQDEALSGNSQRFESSEIQAPDRRAAELVLGLGGVVWLGSEFQQIVDPAELPTEPFVVTKIDLSSKKNIEDEFLSNFRGLAELEDLILTETSITDRGLANLTDQGQQPLAALQTLYLDGTKISQAGLQFLSGSRELSSLMLDETAITEGAVLDQFPKLRNLGVGQTSLTTEEIPQIIARFSQLDRLTMDGRHLTETMASTLGGLPDLRALKLRDLPSDFEPGRLAKLSLLSELYVNADDSTVFGDDFWKVVAGLENLHILMCKGVTDESLAKVQPMPRPQVLIVMSRVVTGTAVAKLMAKFPNLASLTVNYSDWTDNDVQQLHGLKSLGKIDLTKNSASVEAIKALSSALPKCQIISDHGTFEPTRSDVVDSALRFDGVDDFVDIPSLQHEPSTPITIEATISDWGEKYGMICGWRGCAELVLSRDQVGAGFGTTDLKKDGTHKRLAEMPGSRTVRLALVYDASEGRLFANGKLLFRRKLSAPLKRSRGWYSSGFTIGAASFGDRGGSMALVKAIIDEVRVSRTARYDDDYVPEPLLKGDEHTMALYHFDEGQGAVLKDASGNGHDGAIHGATWVKIAAGSSEQASTQQIREAVEWVVSTGGWCTIKSPEDDDEKHWNVTKKDEIPDEPFVVLVVGSDVRQPVDGGPRFEPLHKLCDLTAFHTNSAVTMQEMEWLRNSPELEALQVHSTSQLNDDWAVWLQQFSKLRRVTWNRFSDTGLNHLTKITSLEEIALNTPATADGIRQLASLPNLRSIDLQFDRVTPDLVAAVGALPAVRKLIISWRNRSIEPENWKEIDKLRQLEELWLVDMNLDDSVVTHLKKLTNLRGLQIQGSGISKQGVEQLRKSLPLARITSDEGDFESAATVNRRAAEWILKHEGNVIIRPFNSSESKGVKTGEKLPDSPFNLIQITLSKDGIPEEEFSILSGLTSLETVSLTDCPLTDTGLANLRDSRQLMSLTLGNTQVTDDGLAVLDNFPQLKELNLPNGITDKGFAHVLQCQQLEQLGGAFRSIRVQSLNRLPELDQLQTLYIYGVDASSTADGTSRLEVFDKLPKLTVLHLFRSKLSRSVVKGLGQARQIKNLSLFHCEIETEGLVELERLQHLENLSVAGSGLSDEHVEVLSKLTGLDALGVSDNDFTPEGISRLCKALPACKVVSDHGTFEPTSK